MKTRTIAICIALAAQNLFAAYTEADGYVTLLGHNSGNNKESTFETNIVRTAYGWSDGKDPHSGTNYYCQYQLCTPYVQGGSFSFAGSSLTIAASFRFLADSTATIDDLRLEGGAWLQTATGDIDVTLKGRMSVLAGSSDPVLVENGKKSQNYTVLSKLSGGPEAFMRLYLPKGTDRVSQYTRFDDTADYLGTMSVENQAELRLGSDMPGTLVLASNATLRPIANVKVANLTAADGCILDCRDVRTLHVTNSLSIAAPVTIADCATDTTTPYPVLTLPAGKGAIDARMFSAPHKIYVREEDGLQTLYLERLVFTAYDETTGFATHLKTPAAKDSFDIAEKWSDGLLPHSGTNYYSSADIQITTNSTFGGKSLTTMCMLRWSGIHVTIDDLRVLSGTTRTQSYLTTSGQGGRSYIHGGMTVLSRATDPYPFRFWGSLRDGQCWVSDQSIYGDVDSAFWLDNNLEAGTVSNAVELVGDTSGFFGKCFVSANETLFIGNHPFNGEIVLTSGAAHLMTLASNRAEVALAKLTAQTATSVIIPSTNSLAVSGLSVTGMLEKRGEGLLVASGEVSCGEGAGLTVVEGGIKSTSKTAFDGIPIMFGANSEIHADFASTDGDVASLGLYNEAQVTGSDAIRVVIDNAPEPQAGLVATIPFLTVGRSSADVLRGKFVPQKFWRGYRVAVEESPSGDDMVTFRVKVSPRGFSISIR